MNSHEDETLAEVLRRAYLGRTRPNAHEIAAHAVLGSDWLAARDARVAATARADALASVRALIPTVYFEADGSIADEAIPMRELRAATEDPT